MKIKLDENLPTSLVASLGALGHDVDTVPQENIAGHIDADVWAAAQLANRVLITQDLDFSDARKYAPGTHAGLILVRLAAPSRGALARRIEELFRTEDIERWLGCFVVATDRKIRIRWNDRPSP